MSKRFRRVIDGLECKYPVRHYDSPLSPEEFRGIKRRPVFVILDNLRSAFNVGSIFRTADVVLIEEVITSGITPHPPHPKLEKTAMGVLPYVPAKHFEDPVDAIEYVKEKGAFVLGVEMVPESKTIWEMEYRKPLALVLGNEALGISAEVLNLVDDIVHIPVAGYKNSLNVSVAFGIVIFEVMRQWGYGKDFDWSNR